MAIDQVLAEALEDLDLDPIETDEQMEEDALTQGYGMVEGGASCSTCVCSCCC